MQIGNCGCTTAGRARQVQRQRQPPQHAVSLPRRNSTARRGRTRCSRPLLFDSRRAYRVICIFFLLIFCKSQTNKRAKRSFREEMARRIQADPSQTAVKDSSLHLTYNESRFEVDAKGNNGHPGACRAPFDRIVSAFRFHRSSVDC